MPINKIPTDFNAKDRSQVANLHAALDRLKFNVAAGEKTEKKVEATTISAIKDFQKANNLKPDGNLDNETISALNTAAHDSFISSDKTRTAKIQSLLVRIGGAIDKKERSNRVPGNSTREAIEDFQRKTGMAVDGRLSEDVLTKLRNEVIKQKLGVPTQRGLILKKLQKANKIGGLNLEISPDELKAKELGPTSKKVIEAFQKKYKLPVTGVIDMATSNKLDSVAASKGTFVKRMGRPSASQLTLISLPLRVNKVSPRVNDAQRALSFLGYKIADKEYKTQTFGKTTRSAVIAFQKSSGLTESGHLEKKDIRLLNKMITGAAPRSAALSPKYRVRGSARDDLWNRRSNIVVRLFEKLIDKVGDKPLATKRNFQNGFFDVAYAPPIDPLTGQVKQNLHLVVRFYEAVDNNPANDKLIASQTQYNVKPTHWVNHTAGDTPYLGESDFAVADKIVRKAAGQVKIQDLHETAIEKQISQLALQTSLNTDDVMRLVLAYRVSQIVGKPAILTPEVFYAFIRQNFPPSLPGDLLRGTAEWATIDQLTEMASSGIVLAAPEIHQQMIDTALSLNIVSRSLKKDRDALLDNLKAKREEFALEKPILVGNQSLKGLLDNSAIDQPKYQDIADTFLANGGINSAFWTQIRKDPAAFGGDAIKDFATTVELGNVTKNHVPTIAFLKGKIGADPRFTTASSFAKLDQNEIAALIKENGNKVPDNIPGNNADEKVTNYAAAIKSRMGLVFPEASLIGEVKRSNTDKLTEVSKVEKFLDANPDINLRQDNVDKYLAENNINLASEVREDLKTIQRAHKITSAPVAAAALIDEGLHSSMQIYFKGKSSLTSVFTSKGLTEKQANTVYETSKLQYLRILARLIEFRSETNNGTPAAIISQTYTIAEVKKIVGDIPNLESLFGSLDFCECEHCKSLYGPAAYLTDILRFIGQHDSLIKKDQTTFLKVKDILFQRRPDIRNIKLNCENTDTPMPYIDLACEILESYISPQQLNFIHQTTLSASELKATPEYVRPAAYEKLAVSDFPMDSCFNLFAEETRTYLNYLRVPRFQLMECFQDISDPAAKKPDDTSIAAEYFGISAYEMDLIVTARNNAADQDKYWGFDTTQTDVDVTEITDRAKVDYYGLLELLLVRFVNNPDLANRSEIVRPADTCDTGVQTVNNLSTARFDLTHRFLRLWRKTSWKMWELDLLIRNPKIGNNTIDGTTIVNLKSFQELQEKLKIPFEVLLGFYGDINREVRIQPDSPDLKIDPLYKALFQNVSLTNPIDSNFVGVDNSDDPVELDQTIAFGINAGAPHNGYTPVPTVLSTLAIAQSDFDLIVGKTNNQLSIASLSILLRYTYFARALKLNLKDMLLLLRITNAADPFASLKTTTDCLEALDFMRGTKFSLINLDYILDYSPDSPAGLRDESLVQMVTLLRNTLDKNRSDLDKLGLDDADRSSILAFDASSLPPMTDADLQAALLPLQNILNPVIANFDKAGFSLEESTFVVKFTGAAISAANKEKLVASIKTVQKNLSDLLGQNENQVTSQVAASFNLTNLQANLLLKNLRLAPAPESLLENLNDGSLIEKNLDGTFRTEIRHANFPDCFDSLVLMHKVGLLVSGFGLSDKDLEWFVMNGLGVGTLDFSALPVNAPPVQNQFDKLLNLIKILDFRSSFPEPDTASVRSILDLAKDVASTKPKIFDEIAKLTQWNKTDLTSLDTGLKLNHAAGKLDYTKAETYRRLKKCFDAVKLTGIDAKTILDWAKIDGDLNHDRTVSTQTRQAVKSKYEQDDWLQKITPLSDEIREKKRAALVGYHIENSQRNESDTVVFNGEEIPNPLYWKDSTALYKYFLIDVEMSSCQATSRIKQAISSVQLFIQRCFLNLENRYVKVTQDEKKDAASADAWSQWKWMKNYRIWEANRKVFFYPENWIEPELRDDKSPFFEELEKEILQNEITADNVEAAFLNYLHKLDDVSHLEVCGLYHEMDNLSGDESVFEINKVHVIGRTRSIPHIYYYRFYDMNYGAWSAWDKIDIEIQGDQVVPVVYNRRLHLFWLQFTEKPMKTKKVPPPKPVDNTDPMDAPEPMNIMEIQLGWTIKKKTGWAPKKISKHKLIHPWERPRSSYNLKPYYLPKFNELYLDVYLSTSKEFNDGLFYDPYKSLNPAGLAPDQTYKQALRNPTYLTKNRFNETFLPWHSSSFVFNGEVTNIDLKALQGSYHLEPNVNETVATDSYTYVHANYDPQSKTISPLAPLEFGPRLKLPSGMHFEGTRLTNNKVHSANSNQLRVLEDGASPNLLSGAVSPFELVVTQQDLQLNTLSTTDRPFFYQDNKRAFFVKPEFEPVLNNYGQVISRNRKYRFLPFYHPYTMLFLREFNRDGIDGLLNRNIQTVPQSFPPANNFDFSSYAPTGSVVVDKSTQKDITDFFDYGAYSIYNWELFFHAPLMIACRLMQNQKFEDAMNWFHYVFNPTNIDDLPTPQRYWVTKPFFEFNSDDYRKQRIENILTGINKSDLSEIGKMIEWKNNPFKPHLIARNRPVAYQKNVVMKYLDNLIAWGDMLFGQDTIESINEASLLYLLAHEILGERPKKVPNVKHVDLTFNELEPQLDQFGNARVDVVIEDTLLPVTVVPSTNGNEPIPKIETFYFCIPNNDFLLKYWDTVSDRLFKIRNCMNIQGVVRQLPLFEPPIDPALLVKAAAAGIDLSSVLNDLAAPTAHYRFRIIVQKAIEFCNEVRALGDKLLSVLEKKDAEELAFLRSQHEIQLLEAVKEVRKKQIDEAVETIGGLNAAMETATAKETYYDEVPRMNLWEIGGVSLHGVAIASELAGTIVNVFGAGISMVPDLDGGGSGFGGSPVVKVKFGGTNFGNAASKTAEFLKGLSAVLHSTGSLLETQGGYTRRDDENKQMAKLARIEKDQVQFQINAAEIRQAIAEKELDNQELQIVNAGTVDDFLRNKFSNQQLYSWMITQISGVYFQAYQLAFEMGKKAEKCFQYELGIQESNIIQFGYWDSLKKGLLSGDRLAGDLRRLESAYIDQNKREFEITKHISLAQMFPLSLITLKQTGKCTFTFPEWLFDMDYPGHYMRRIKNVSISIPCIVGPYTGVSCTLSLLKNETRVDPTGSYDRVEADTRFRSMFGSISSIATSNGQNDSGMFELNFNDERYLPFEGAGAISDWQIELPIENNYFDFNTISDVILHVSYTSRSGGGLLAGGARNNLKTVLPVSTGRLFSLKHEFGTEWYRFFHPDGEADQEFVATLKPEHFPFFIRGKLSTGKIKNLDLFILSDIAGDYTIDLTITNKNPMNDLTASAAAEYGNAHHLSTPPALTADQPDILGEIRMKLAVSTANNFRSLAADSIEDVFFLVGIGA